MKIILDREEIDRLIAAHVTKTMTGTGLEATYGKTNVRYDEEKGAFYAEAELTPKKK